MAELSAFTHGPASGRPVLAIHGVTGHGRRFERLAREALGDRHVVSVDLRGHGCSTWMPPWTIEQHVQDLQDTLDARGLERVDVIGHSFGGLLAAHLAASAPARVERLVLLDPAIALDPELAAAAADDQRNPPAWDSVAEAIAARREQRPPQGYADSDADVAAHLSEGPDGRFRFRFFPAAAVNACGEAARPRPSLAGLGIPALLVRAGQADFVSDELVAGLRDDLGNAFRLETLDVGHIVYWDAFEQTAALVTDHLAR
jgi:lipase